jgi:hypothetical protein
MPALGLEDHIGVISRNNGENQAEIESVIAELDSGVR